MKSVLFIHRSVGKNLLKDGRLREEILSAASKANIPVKVDNIDNNFDKTIPGVDTKPTDYLEYFSHASVPADLVVIKSCYPNNAIKSDLALEKLKDTYTQLVAEFVKHSPGKLLIITTPALRPIATNKHGATRARELANWLMKQDFGDRVSVFDFYNLLAESHDLKDKNMLQTQFRRLAPWDNHPNKRASLFVAPILASKIVKILI